MVTSELEGKILESLSEAKEKFEKLKKEAKNPYFKSNYSDLNALLDMIVPVLSECGIDIYQPLNVIETTEGKVVDILQTIFECDDGSRLVSTITLGDFDDIQKRGAAITYLRRYMLKTFLCLQDEDDDGETATGRGGLGSKKTASKGRTSKKKEEVEDTKEESGDSFTSKGRGRGRSAKKEDSKEAEETTTEEAPKEEKKSRGRRGAKKEEEPAEEKTEEKSSGRRRRGRK